MSCSPYKLCQKEKRIDKSFYYKKNNIGLLPKLIQKGKYGLKSSSYIKIMSKVKGEIIKRAWIIFNYIK